MLNPYQAEVKPMVDFLKGALPYKDDWYYSLPLNQLRAIYNKQMSKRLANFRKFNEAVALATQTHVEIKIKEIDGTTMILTDSGLWEEAQN